MNTSIGPEQLHDAALALVTVIEDEHTLAETCRQIVQEAGDRPDLRASAHTEVAAFAEQDRALLDARWNYVVRAIGNRAAREPDIACAVADVYAVYEADGTTLSPTTLGFVHRILSTTCSGMSDNRARPHAVEQDTEISPSLGVALVEVPAKRSRPYIDAATTFSVPPACSTPETGTAPTATEQTVNAPAKRVNVIAKRAGREPSGKVWISLTNPRTFRVASGRPERIVRSYPLVATDSTGSLITFANSVDEHAVDTQHQPSKPSRSNDTVPSSQTVISRTRNPDGSTTITSTHSPLHHANLATDGDAYRIAPDGKHVELYVPTNRAGFDTVSLLVLDSLVERARRQGARDHAGIAAIRAALRATGALQPNVIDTFRRVNTGASNDPSVNPRPVVVAKRR